MILQIGHADFVDPLRNLAAAVILPGIREIELLDKEQIGNFKLVIIIQRTPDEYHTADMMEIVNKFPLTQLIVIYGAWCEGDSRNRLLWPVCMRIPWYLAEIHIEQMLKCSGNYLPLTASREELFRETYCKDLNCSQTIKSPAKRMSIISCDPSYANSLKSSLEESYLHIEVINSDKMSDRNFESQDIIFDLDDTPRLLELNMRHLCLLEKKNILLMAGFPHQHNNLSFPIFSKLTPMQCIVSFFRNNGLMDMSQTY